MSDAIEKRLRMLRSEFRAVSHATSLEYDLYSLAVAQGDELERLRAENAALRASIVSTTEAANRQVDALRAENERIRGRVMQLLAENASQAERIRELEDDLSKAGAGPTMVGIAILRLWNARLRDRLARRVDQRWAGAGAIARLGQFVASVYGLGLLRSWRERRRFRPALRPRIDARSPLGHPSRRPLRGVDPRTGDSPVTRPSGFPHDSDDCACPGCARHARRTLAACPRCDKPWAVDSPECPMHRAAPEVAPTR